MKARWVLGTLFLVSLLIFQSAYIPTASAAPVLKFNKPSYTPFDKVTLTFESREHNTDPERIETALITLAGTGSSKKVELTETGPNSGAFTVEMVLSPDLSKFPGDFEARRDDGLTASYRVDADTTVRASVFIVYHEATASFDKTSYKIDDDEAKVTVIEPDANRRPDFFDSIDVKVSSNTDPAGITLTLMETDSSSGTFEQSLLFTLSHVSSGNRLRVSDGDNIRIRYVDNTLPEPATLTSDGITTREARDIVGESIFGRQIPSIEKTTAAEPEILDSMGQAAAGITTGDQVLIQTEITNNQGKKQPFAFIVQIKDSDGITVSLSWLNAELPPNDSMKVAQSWIPLSAGEYEVEAFVWEDIDNPTALSPKRMKNVVVAE